MAPAAAAPGIPNGAQLLVDLGCRSRRLSVDHRIERSQHPDALCLAEPTDSIGIVIEGLTHYLTLWLVRARGRLPQAGNGTVIERERDLYHIDTILPYQRSRTASGRMELGRALTGYEE